MPELGLVDVAISTDHVVTDVRAWTAETPYLFYFTARRSTTQLRVEPCGLSREVVAFGETVR